MKRIPVHVLFALAALGTAGLCVAHALRLQQVRSLNAAIVAASEAPVAGGAATVPRDAAPQVRLARSIALSRAGASDAAFKGYSGLLEPGTPDDVARDALFDLGNMVLRQGIAAGHPQADGSIDAKAAASAEVAPLIELAKQRYRDLLRAHPGDWDARYNLERALRLAPEEQDAATPDEATNVERRNVMLRGMEQGDLP